MLQIQTTECLRDDDRPLTFRRQEPNAALAHGHPASPPLEHAADRGEDTGAAMTKAMIHPVTLLEKK